MLLTSLLISLVPQVALGFSVPSPNHHSAVLPPTKDPWYKAPTGQDLGHFPPGHVFKVRHAPGNLTQVVGRNCSDAYQVLYRTTDSNYRPSWAVTTLLAPSTKKPHRGLPLLSYQFAYDSSNLDASPSATLYRESYGFVLGEIPSELDDIGPALGRGWFVNVPDYEGPLASFGLGVQAGHATIDSIRAVQSIQQGPGRDAPTAMWGYSGGSIATEFAAELQVQYAPELELRGVALGGLIPNLTSSYDYVSGSPLAGDLPNLLLGVVSQNKQAEEYLVSRLKTEGPYNRTTFLSVRHQQLIQVLPGFAGQDISKYFKGGKSDIVDSAVMNKVLNPTIAGYHGVPTPQLFVYKAIHDDASPVKDTDGLVSRFCGVGAEIEYQRNTVGAHVSEIANGAPRAVEFLKAVLDGTYKSSGGCIVRNVTVDVSQ